MDPPSGFGTVDLSRIVERHEGFHASREEARLASVSSSWSIVDATERARGRSLKGRNLRTRVRLQARLRGRS